MGRLCFWQRGCPSHSFAPSTLRSLQVTAASSGLGVHHADSGGVSVGEEASPPRRGATGLAMRRFDSVGDNGERKAWRQAPTPGIRFVGVQDEDDDEEDDNDNGGRR